MLYPLSYERASVLVGATGFEPATSCTPCKRAIQAAPRPGPSGEYTACLSEAPDDLVHREDGFGGVSLGVEVGEDNAGKALVAAGFAVAAPDGLELRGREVVRLFDEVSVAGEGDAVLGVFRVHWAVVRAENVSAVFLREVAGGGVGKKGSFARLGDSAGAGDGGESLATAGVDLAFDAAVGVVGSGSVEADVHLVAVRPGVGVFAVRGRAGEDGFVSDVRVNAGDPEAVGAVGGGPEVGGHGEGGAGVLGVQSDGGGELSHLAEAAGSLGGVFGFGEDREEDGGEYRDDGDNDQKFD